MNDTNTLKVRRKANERTNNALQSLTLHRKQNINQYKPVEKSGVSRIGRQFCSTSATRRATHLETGELIRRENRQYRAQNTDRQQTTKKPNR
jgi:hypothetical protein